MSPPQSSPAVFAHSLPFNHYDVDETTTAFQVACEHNRMHTLTLTVDGEYTNEYHGPDEDKVIVALGGKPSACGLLQVAFSVAKGILDSQNGVRDVPGWTYNYNSTPLGSPWLADHNCGVLCVWSASHIRGIEHQASRVGADAETTRWMLSWLQTKTGVPDNMWVREQVAEDSLRVAVPGHMHLTYLRIMREAHITPQFVYAALPILEPLLPSQGTVLLTYLMYLRERGIRVEWLTQLSQLVHSGVTTKWAREPSAFLFALTEAGGQPASVVAEQMNTGTFEVPDLSVNLGAFR